MNESLVSKKMNTELFDKYAELAIQKKAIESELEALKPHLLDEVCKTDDRKLKRAGVTFSASMRKRWAYSEETSQLEKDLKQRKKKEEAAGIATYEENACLVVRV